MHQERILFDYHPAFLLVCIALGFGYAYLLYQSKHTWGVAYNRILFGARAVLVFFIALLILGPVLKLTQNLIEKPEVVFLIDNSLSVKEATDSMALKKLQQQLHDAGNKLQAQGYEATFRDLAGAPAENFSYTNSTSDLSGALRDVVSNYEGKNLAGIVLMSDGIYNTGSSPLYATLRVPVFTVGIGDTSRRTDLTLKNVAFNKIAYQGNRYPVKAEVLAEGLSNEQVTVTLFHDGKQVGSQTKNSAGKSLVDFDFQLDANEKGLQRIDVVVSSGVIEKNTKNNRASVFVEVVEGRKKILVIAPAPHPDIKALRAVVDKNSNYEFILHIPGVKEAESSMLIPGKTDLVIFHQVFDVQGKTTPLLMKFLKGNSALLLMFGTGTNLRSIQPGLVPLSFDKTGQWDEVTPVINAAFRNFGFADNSNQTFSKYPPASVPFGKFTFPVNASVLLFQQIGSVATERPLLFTYDENSRKTGVLIAEGIWRWRLNEYSETDKTEAFDEVFSKLIQYLSTQEDKRKFRSFPLQNEFTDAAPVVFESQVYNDLFEQIYGNTINLKIKDEKGKVTAYSYVTSQGGMRYRIGGLKEGVYQYSASTLLSGKQEEVKGEFLVKARNIESQNLTADFGLLQKLARASGGKFYQSTNISSLETDLPALKAKGLIHSDESFNPLINLRWVFFVLLALVSAEWFTRKYLGAV